jgi:tRNA G10  N-methylase Trm11
LPYLLPRSLTKGTGLAFILAFGDLSYLEICTVLGDRLLRSKQLSAQAALVEMKDESGGYERLAGVHKVVVPVTLKPKSWSASIKDVEGFLEALDDSFNFSVSLYAADGVGEGEYEQVASTVLEAVRKMGFRKANLIRPRNGTEVLTKEIVSRKIIDFVVLRLPEGYWVGATSFIPDTQQFQLRSNERPVVSADISISSRLAKLLLNVAGVRKGQLVLDPFCGSGTILSEALLMGANCIGVDRDPVRIENTERNLEWLSKTLGISDRSYSLKVGDATRLETLMEGVQVDTVVTEPIFLPRMDFAPSLDKAKKLIRNSSRLYSESLYSIASIVRKGGRVVIVTPSLRTAAEKDVSVVLENVEEARLKPFRPSSPQHFDYPVKISHEKTRWVRRLVYVFERV